MRLLTVLTAASALGLTAGVANAATVEVKDAVARVVVIPEARQDIKVEFLTTNPSLPLQVRSAGGKTIVDGDLDRKIKSCRSEGGKARVYVAGVGDIAYEDMPQIVVRMPKDARIEAGGAVFGSVGKTNSLELSNAGCGDWTVGNVAGKLSINIAGSGDTHAGSSGQALLRVAGSGDVRTQAINGALEISVAGSGDVNVTSIAGPLSVKIAGSGDVNIRAGKASEMEASIAGSGSVDFGGVAGSLNAKIAGSGDVHVESVTGEVSKAIVGSGNVSVG
ncbi:MAG: DUF2807 domain-containing protein [Phenylobacterium sp.]|uniref:DUF2807 domain-containing protein n=1 Tax=Phenylobacterium ferrooxidans TaxID=2982689 RepID=A0ABW6CYH7_9CAUL|nr:DUF2807 domain-containing protein [Phenylobacterium sp.]MDO8910547.1 DUF2807 domain-containing protein [Phenylobacterium sp.]MDO9245633.1 DUF2807 domain-containing protein [Phenylobacterium sp.]MDP3101376.1 DUF2807 domain-containing protein [Phenylobacterium sp.]MDP3634323.1 DUF2807 domain-containing protein [Phenylobacterium sp.]MDP3867672.1 DUF2807 domain-containing protein [Phenylobacterium sp.]